MRSSDYFRSLTNIEPLESRDWCQPDTPAAQALDNLLKSLWLKALDQCEGIVADSNVEYLHVYRVSIRKMRSMLSLFKSLYHDSARRRLNERLKAMAQRSNRLRDLDVYLSQRGWFLLQAPALFSGGVERLFNEFARQRDEEQRRFVAYVESNEFREDVEAVSQGLIELLQSAKASKSEVPIRDAVDKQLRKRFGRLAHQCQDLSDEVEDEAIHEIRIIFKKVRYLLDNFRPLFDRKRFKQLKKQLKGMQNHLGGYNDLSVQVDFLSRHFEEQRSQHQCDSDYLAAIAALIGALYTRKEPAKQQVIQDLEAFAKSVS